MPLSSRREVSQFVQRKLLFRLRRLAILFLVIFSIVIYEITVHYIAIYTAVLGFLLGWVIGWLVAKRMHHISWDAELSKAVTKMDRIGIVILVLYILFSIARHWIFSYWFQGAALSAFTMSVAAGGMLSRFYATRKQIRKILKTEGKLHPNRERT
jgi:hypothetical protein